MCLAVVGEICGCFGEYSTGVSSSSERSSSDVSKSVRASLRKAERMGEDCERDEGDDDRWREREREVWKKETVFLRLYGCSY